jgi:catechol 2,3-dioxygenase-like lactoylglutathione lyase family enzyme
VAEIRRDQIVIAVADWERSNQFYRNVLGAELVDVDSAPPITSAGSS